MNVRRLTLGLISLALIGCRNSAPPPPSTGTNAAMIRGLYDAMARGDVPTFLGAMDAAIQWREADGLKYADRNPYVGPQAVAEGVLQRFVADVDSLAAVPQNVIDGGSTVVVEGRYKGRMKATGKHVDAQFVHIFEIRNGKIVRFRQYTDTRQWAQAAER